MSEPFTDFAAASHAVLEYLQANVPLALWMVTRTDGAHWVVLNAADRGYGVKVGDMLPYAESLCAQRIECNAPSIAPDVDAVPVSRCTCAAARTDRCLHKLPIAARGRRPVRHALRPASAAAGCGVAAPGNLARAVRAPACDDPALRSRARG